MRLTEDSHARIAQTHSIVDISCPDFTAEQYATGWIACCKSLNGSLWPRTRFERDMRGDPMIREDGILFSVLDGVLASTASVQFGRICPYVGWDYDKSATLHMVGTREGFSRRGAGLNVCAAAVEYALAHGANAVYLTTDEFRISAIKIYLKLGFLPVLYDDEQATRWRAVGKTLAREIACMIP